MKYRIRHLLAATTALIAALVVLDLIVAVVADGRYTLTVVIDENLASSTESVSFYPVLYYENADAVIASLEDHSASMEHQKTNDPFTIRVGYSFRVSGLGRRSEGAQAYSEIIVVLHHSDGTREIHRLPVPHRDVSRRVLVSNDTAVGQLHLSKPE